MIRNLLIWFGAAGALAGQEPYAARWAELRRRIAGGGAQELLQEWDKQDGARYKVLSETHRRPDSRGLSPQREQVRRAACGAGVPPDLALAIIELESGFDNHARGELDELGASQILPSTAAIFGFDRERLAVDIDYNVRAGVAVIRSLLEYFGEDEQAAIRGYNGGPGWRLAPASTLRKIEQYAAAVNERRMKYVHAANCN